MYPSALLKQYSCKNNQWRSLGSFVTNWLISEEKSFNSDTKVENKWMDEANDSKDFRKSKVKTCTYYKLTTKDCSKWTFSRSQLCFHEGISILITICFSECEQNPIILPIMVAQKTLYQDSNRSSSPQTQKEEISCLEFLQKRFMREMTWRMEVENKTVVISSLVLFTSLEAVY